MDEAERAPVGPRVKPEDVNCKFCKAPAKAGTSDGVDLTSLTSSHLSRP
jgi:hypothetical protein